MPDAFGRRPNNQLILAISREISFRHRPSKLITGFADTACSPLQQQLCRGWKKSLGGTDKQDGHTDAAIVARHTDHQVVEPSTCIKIAAYQGEAELIATCGIRGLGPFVIISEET